MPPVRLLGDPVFHRPPEGPQPHQPLVPLLRVPSRWKESARPPLEELLPQAEAHEGEAVTQLKLAQAERETSAAMHHLDRDQVFEAICHLKIALELLEDHLMDAGEFI